MRKLIPPLERCGAFEHCRHTYLLPFVFYTVLRRGLRANRRRSKTTLGILLLVDRSAGTISGAEQVMPVFLALPHLDTVTVHPVYQDTPLQRELRIRTGWQT